MTITCCSRCALPAHASETDDLDRCAACAGLPWSDRYMITSVTGRVWSRAMVRRSALSWSLRPALPYDAQDIDALLDDDAWMRRRRGEIPARVVEALADAAHDRYRARTT